MNDGPWVALPLLYDIVVSHPLELRPDKAFGRWTSLLVPTRKFGPESWGAFVMRTRAGVGEIGPFVAWIVVDARRPRISAYLEEPIAASFGTVRSFPAEIAYVVGELVAKPDFLACLDECARSFFAGAAPSDSEIARAEVVRVLSALGDETWELHAAAFPDFFAWIMQ